MKTAPSTIHSEIGQQNHRMVENLEKSIQRIRRLGYSENQAGRLAMIMTFRFEGFTAEQATQAAREIYPPENDDNGHKTS